MENHFPIFEHRFLETWGNTVYSNRVSSEKKDNACREVGFLEHNTTERAGIERQFDAFCKKLLKNEARDSFKEDQRRWNNEKPLSTLSEHELTALQALDEYPVEFYRFRIMDETIDIRSDLLGAALENLSEHNRMITLLAYCFDLSDVKIGSLLNEGRRAIQYRRLRSLEQIRKYMEEHGNA